MPRGHSGGVMPVMARPVDDKQAQLRAIEEKTLFEWVNILDTFVANYGRPLSETRVKSILKHFDPLGLGTILLSMRDDNRYAIIDGQHRIAAAMEYGMTSVPSRVYIDLSYGLQERNRLEV